MQQSFDTGALRGVTYLVGDEKTLANMPAVPAKAPFDDSILDFFNEVSKSLMKDSRSKAFSDVVTLAFWLRKASTLKLKERFEFHDSCRHIGRGVVFHIAPSNVPVNFAYSLAAGLLTGNANIVRVPSRAFQQVDIIADSILCVLEKMPEMRGYIALIRYERDKSVNDILSGMADTRVVWGGDATIAELRKSELPPRSTEITFADRFSIAVIDSGAYLSSDNKADIAQDFYNDTYLTDQNACTSPRLVVWVGQDREKAKMQFWDELHKIAGRRYTFQSIQGVNKLTSSCLAAVKIPGAVIEEHKDNLIVRVKVPTIAENLMDLKDNSGYFFEYDCDDILELRPLCNDKRCQTVALLGDSAILQPLLDSAPRGIDRIVPIGKTMDFDLVWDGYNLVESLTRTVAVE